MAWSCCCSEALGSDIVRGVKVSTIELRRKLAAKRLFSLLAQRSAPTGWRRCQNLLAKIVTL
jgi:hypothetical protein